MNLGQFRDEFLLSMQDQADQSESSAIFRFLVEERMGIGASELNSKLANALSESDLIRLMSDLSRLKSGEPLHYVLGCAWFREMKLKVNHHVLIPRPETEELTELILKENIAPDSVILDLCSGSGCIALALKSALPSADVFGFELDVNAMSCAKENSVGLRLNVQWIQADLLSDNLSELYSGQADLIVSNPPYIPECEKLQMSPGVYLYEPSIALFVPDGDPLLFYKRISSEAIRVLKPNGTLWFEINPHFATEINSMMGDAGFHSVRVVRDLSGKQRFVTGRK